MTAAARLDAYLARLGLESAPAPDADGLAILQAAQRRRIAFENLDVRLARPILIDGDSVFDKLVTRRRGGYCFEQNRLFADMLGTLGLPARPLLARVLLGAAPGDIPPRTHTLLLLEIEGQPWVADAGFGGSFVPPLPLQDGAEATTPDGASHRLRRTGQPGDVLGEWLLERAGPTASTDGRSAETDDWQPQYAFHLDPVAPIDLEQCNHWTSTRAASRFTTLHIVSIVLPDGFAALTERDLSIARGPIREVREITTPEKYRVGLADVFGLTLAPDDVAALPLFAPLNSSSAAE
ncbi:N-hydroxyarylamine O-acetyltransferase [Sphingobium sp. B11D3B]|uniref:arylamine N-acetyltransferase family protein n=1 Tax=Sphingobium sp. B11D3B TaxID=2940575 RepID=UPI002227DC96|nr:arylamine N-acetyltransferase [Sphingobium sp. B11D3B]MCW2387277.1 N-hydroxyarylamine O-acetyltransferase [Sphingobium sp. B11D3B]